MNEIRKRVLTFNPEVLVTQDSQPDMQPHPLSSPGKKKRKNHRSKTKKKKKAASDAKQDDSPPEERKEETFEELFNSISHLK